jgi:hypothetical protein
VSLLVCKLHFTPQLTMTLLSYNKPVVAPRCRSGHWLNGRVASLIFYIRTVIPHPSHCIRQCNRCSVHNWGVSAKNDISPKRATFSVANFWVKPALIRGWYHSGKNRTRLDENEWWNIRVFLPVLLYFLSKNNLSISFCLISVKINYLRNCNYIPVSAHAKAMNKIRLSTNFHWFRLWKGFFSISQKV